MISSCACGRVEFLARGTPIASGVCYCDDCQAGGRQLAALPNAPPVLGSDGGTEYILFRKDRVTCTKGAELLQNLKLREKTATNRAVATCCNSAMMIRFDDMKHWVSMYRARFVGDLPPVEMRICTRFAPAGAVLPTDVPSYPSFPLGFLGKLVMARIGMVFFR